MTTLVESVPGIQPAPWSAVITIIVLVVTLGPLLMLAIMLLDRRVR